MGNEHHHHHYHTDNSAVEKVEKLRKESEEKHQMQISKLEQEKKELIASQNKILEQTKRQNELMKSQFEEQKKNDEKKWNEQIKLMKDNFDEQKKNDEKKWNEQIKLIQDNFEQKRKDDEINRQKEIKLKEDEIEILKNQIKEQNEASIKYQKEQQQNNQNLIDFMQKTYVQSEDKFNQFMQSHQQMIERLMDQTNNEQIQMYQRDIESMKNQISQLELQKEESDRRYIEQNNIFEEKLKNAKDEFERKEIERKQKEQKEKKQMEDNAYNEFIETRKKYLGKKYDKIIEIFSKNEYQFCNEELTKFDQSYIIKLINDVLESENINQIVLENLKYHIELIINSEKNAVVEHINILILGATGVGKSTLINAILKEEICPTGQGKPVTKGEPKYYISNKEEGSQKYIRLADSRGIEKDEYGVKAVVNSAKNFIQNRLETKDPDQYVHLIWYCITGSRFEDIEQKSLIELSKLYTEKNLPIIVVYTQASNDNFIETMKKLVEDMKIQVSFQDVLAQKIIHKRFGEIPPFGIDELISKSIDKAKNAIDSACNQALRTNCILNIINLIDDISVNIENSLIKKIENDLSKIKKGINFTKTSEIIGNIVIFIFYQYLNIKNRFINKETTKIISAFVKFYFEETLKIYQKKLREIVKNEAEQITNDIMDIQIKINQKNEEHLNSSKQMSQETIYKIEYANLFNTLKEYAELFCIKNAIRYIWKPINLLIQENLGQKYKNCIDNNTELRKKFDEYAQKAFNNIDNNLKNLK